MIVAMTLGMNSGPIAMILDFLICVLRTSIATENDMKKPETT